MPLARATLLAALLPLAACERGGAPAPPAGFVERVAPLRAPSPDGGRPPLLVLLHGIGADEHDLLPFAARLDPRLVVVGLRAPQAWQGGFAWFRIDFLPGGRIVPDVGQARDALARLVAWIAAAPDRHGTDAARTFLLGFSQGAIMSLGVLTSAPERLAGVVALSGRPPEGIFEPTAAAAAIGRVPLLVAHGTRDDVLPVTEGRRTQAAFAPLSRDLTYREFPIGHGISEDELALVADWLTARLDPREAG
jgi:phospholipase/carboxylesterase